MAGHSEVNFEDAIEARLFDSGWLKGIASNFDAELGLDPVALGAFVEETQPKEWAKLVDGYGAAAATKFGKRVADEIDTHGSVHVLRKGVRDRGANITLAFFKPTHGLTPDLLKAYAANRLLVYRQVHHSESNAHQSLDLMLGLNGIPVATAELKNQFTGQSVEDAMAQYRDPKQRNPKDRIFARRCLAHFAVDPLLVFMTTHLAGGDTVFLPFNQGSGGAGEDGGKGNPPNPLGHKTAYLWEQVWQPDNLLDLLHRYVQETAPAKGRKVLFPRYHQWDVVTRLVTHAGLNGAGHEYLLQHSAGSGKSNSIAWLAHRLADLHTPSDPALLSDDAKDEGLGADELVFHKVVVITDRTVLDEQLQATISGFDHVKGMLQRIDVDSKQLRNALEDTKTKIIITTLQKFPVIANDAKIEGKRIAIIVDEAHSSQTGEAAKSVKSVLGGNAGKVAAAKDKEHEDDDQDGQDELAAYMAALSASAASRGKQKNLSFFAFTATPKGKTLQLFGTRTLDAAGEATYRPFHLYSMRQAIEEGFILDVLANYVTYRRYYRLANGLSSGDPEVEKGKAAAQLARYVDLHPASLDQRAEIIVEHFRAVTATKIGGKGKAMVVTRSRLQAVRYFEAIKRYISKHGIVGVEALVAFSGKVIDPDDTTETEHTESNMNGFPDTQTPVRFRDDYQVLIVAEKYQTGFDEPLLHTMYVDKKLEGVKAVQTLSRLNRITPGKTDTFILDFVNTAEEMREQFAPFFQTTWTEETDPNLLYNLQTRISGHAIIDPTEQQLAVQAFLQTKGQPKGAAHKTMWANITPAVDRFEQQLSPEDQSDLRDALKAYTRAYAFLGQVVPFTDESLESLFYYAKLLVEALPDDKTDLGGIDLGDTALQFIGHEAGVVTSGAVQVDDSDGQIETFTGGGRGGQQDPIMARLSEIIRTFNEAFGIDLTEADALMLFVELPSHLANDEKVQKIAADNTEEQFGLTVKEDDVAGAIFDRQEASDRLLKLFTEDPRFAAEAMKQIRAATYKTARERGGDAA
jgi:type I restriction enzyme R subunit